MNDEATDAFIRKHGRIEDDKEIQRQQAEIMLEGSIQRQLRNNDQMTDDLAAAIAPMTFRQRMDASVKQAEILLDASRKMLAAAEAMLASVNAAIDELK